MITIAARHKSAPTAPVNSAVSRAARRRRSARRTDTYTHRLPRGALPVEVKVGDVERHDDGEVHGVLVDDTLLDVENLRSQAWNAEKELREDWNADHARMTPTLTRFLLIAYPASGRQEETS